MPVNDAVHSPYLDAIAQVMRVVSQDLAKRTWPANPFPRGMKVGCGTERIYIALLASSPKWLEHHEIMHLANCSRGATDWGCRYLIAAGMARAIPSFRNPQYLRYQAVKQKREE